MDGLRITREAGKALRLFLELIGRGSLRFLSTGLETIPLGLDMAEAKMMAEAQGYTFSSLLPSLTVLEAEYIADVRQRRKAKTKK